jgi:hypothetical protein
LIPIVDHLPFPSFDLAGKCRDKQPGECGKAISGYGTLKHLSKKSFNKKLSPNPIN